MFCDVKSEVLDLAVAQQFHIKFVKFHESEYTQALPTEHDHDVAWNNEVPASVLPSNLFATPRIVSPYFVVV